MPEKITEELKVKGEDLLKKVKELIHEGNIRRIIIKNDEGETYIEIPLTLGVVDGHNSGIGGGCLILIRLADAKLIALDGRETAPLSATRNMYLRRGKPQPELSRLGPLACATPGALAAYHQAVRRYGRLPLADLLRPAAKIDCHYASNGFFFEKDQLLRDAHKLKDIPVTIINGRYDIICPPVTAYRLHKLLPKSKLMIVEEAGHSEGEPGITEALVNAVAEFE